LCFCSTKVSKVFVWKKERDERKREREEEKKREREKEDVFVSSVDPSCPI
jgi:hypothetical protein